MAHRLMPISALPATSGLTFPDAQITSNSFVVEGLSVIGSPGSDAELHYVWEIPPALPSGTAKLEISMVSSTTGNASIEPAWKSVAAGEDFDITSANLNSEGLQAVTFNAGDVFTFKRLTLNLDADTVVADEYIVSRLLMDSGNWTMSNRLLFLPSIIWE